MTTTMTTDTTGITEKVIPYRNLPPSVVSFYNIQTGIKDSDSSEIYRAYKYPSQTKYRFLPKDFTKNYGFRANSLFGMDKFNAGSSKHITIVEGEDDVPAAYFMLGERSPVVGLPSASVSQDLIRDCYIYLNSFTEIIICTDNDDAGKKAADKLAEAFPNKVSKVSLTKYKDPQEFLEAKAEKDFFFAWNNREKYVPKGYYNTTKQFKSILDTEESNIFYPTPIEELNKLIFGLPLGQLVLLLGQEGQGKTEVMRALEYHLVKNNPTVNIGVLHMEESKKTCLTSYLCYELMTNLRDPYTTVAPAVLEKGLTELTKNGNLYLFDHMVDEDPLSIVGKVRYMATALGCKVFFIDPIQQLAYGADTSVEMSDEKVLTRISVQLEKLATELNLCIVMTAHINDDGSTRSSKMIGKSAGIRIMLERDHMNDDPTIKNTTYLKITKNRPFSFTGKAGAVVFDPKSFTLSEV